MRPTTDGAAHLGLPGPTSVAGKREGPGLESQQHTPGPPTSLGARADSQATQIMVAPATLMQLPMLRPPNSRGDRTRGPSAPHLWAVPFPPGFHLFLCKMEGGYTYTLQAPSMPSPQHGSVCGPGQPGSSVTLGLGQPGSRLGEAISQVLTDFLANSFQVPLGLLTSGRWVPLGRDGV